MKRNIKQYAEAGRKKITAPYDLRTGEMTALMDQALKDPEGAFYAVEMAFYAGFEAGYRQRKQEGGKI